MPHLDARTHDRELTKAFGAFDLDTGKEVDRCVAVNTEEGWVEVIPERKAGDDPTPLIVRIHGRYEVRRTSDGKRWEEVM